MAADSTVAASMAEAELMVAVDSTVVVDADNESRMTNGSARMAGRSKLPAIFLHFNSASKPCTLRRLLARMSGHRGAAVVK
jgi:hypothetical protein